MHGHLNVKFLYNSRVGYRFSNQTGI